MSHNKDLLTYLLTLVIDWLTCSEYYFAVVFHGLLLRRRSPYRHLPTLPAINRQLRRKRCARYVKL